MMADGQVHTSDTARRFLDMLDLGSGRELFEKCVSYWPHYHHVVKNRKSCILNLACRAIANDGIEQVAILGAGLDPLSLEIHARHADCKIFEIDVANMDTKTAMLQSINPSITDSIKCITLDLSNTDAIMPSLLESGWNPDAPSLMVLEGISYYLTVDALWKTIGMLKSASGTNRIILEYFIPPEKISKDRLPIARYPFDLIASDADIAHIARYDVDDITVRAERLGGKLLQHYDMGRMEQERVPESTLFKPRQSGWIEVCMLSI